MTTHPRSLPWIAYGVAVAAVIGLLLTPLPPDRAAAATSWPTVGITLVTKGLVRPNGIVAAPDGSGRLFVLEQPGRVRVIVNGKLQAKPYLDISRQVLFTGLETGILGMAFAPDFKTSGRFFVTFSSRVGTTELARFIVNPKLDVASPSIQTRVLSIQRPGLNHRIHWGGCLQFGPDKMLYMSAALALGRGSQPEVYTIIRPMPAYDAYIFDLDGTVYLGNALLPNAGAAIRTIRERGRRTVFLSNNPTHTAAEYSAKLTRLGLPTPVDDVVNSSIVMADFLARLRETDGINRLFVVGEQPLCEVLAGAGFELVDDARATQAVIASFDRTFVYRKLQIAFDAIRAGARFFATNGDRYCRCPAVASPTPRASSPPSRPAPARAARRLSVSPRAT